MAASPSALASTAASSLGAVSPKSPIPSGSLPKYSDYTRTSAADKALTTSTLIVTLFQDVADLVPNAGPLSQILGVTKDVMAMVTQMRDNKSDCDYLIERILRILWKIAMEVSTLNIPLERDGATTQRLTILEWQVRSSMTRRVGADLLSTCSLGSKGC